MDVQVIDSSFKYEGVVLYDNPRDSVIHLLRRKKIGVGEVKYKSGQFTFKDCRFEKPRGVKL